MSEPTGKHEPPGAPEEPADEARPRVMLLGSGELSRELAAALRRLGAEVMALDSDAEAPAVSAEFRRLQPDFVATVTDSISDEALQAVEAIEAQVDDEFTQLVPSARSVRLTTDREGIRRLAADELGLPTAPFWFAGSVSELKAVAAHAGFPLLLKPVAGVVGRGQVLVAGPDDIELAWQRAMGREAGGTRQRVLAETVVEIEFLVSLLAVRTDGPNGPVIEFCKPIGHRHAVGVLESWQPQEMSPAASDAAKSIAARIVKALGGRGVFSVELMINGDEVYFADVTACPHPSAWVTLRSQRLSAFELQARAILGLPMDTMMVSPGAARVLNPLNAEGAAPSADELTAALGVPESDVRVSGAVALATAPDIATARDRARDVAAALSRRRQP
jgi:phosphoribosylglycinamide formyltransferase 2